MTRIARNPIRAGLLGAFAVWSLIVASIFVTESRGVRRDLAAKRLAVQGVSGGSAVRMRTAPAGASTPSGGLTAPLDDTERNG